MKFIIVIKGVSVKEYRDIRQDLIGQFNGPVPFFAHLPGDYAEIKIVWIDERDSFTEALARGEIVEISER